MCGICGIIDRDANVVNIAYFMLLWLQHRGQEAFGFGITDGKLVTAEKWEGRVDRFGPPQFAKLTRGGGIKPRAAVGHVRYSNTGSNTPENYQPFTARTKFGKIAIVHNGNLINTQEILAFLEEHGYDPDGTSDSELIALLIAHQSRVSHASNIEEAIRIAVSQLQGSFSLIIMTTRQLIGLRDPWGIRPLCFGRLNGSGSVFASESCALDTIGAEWVCDLDAGEMIVADLEGNYGISLVLPKICEKMCIFEHIYFAGPGSVMHSRFLETVRRHMGEELWLEHPVKVGDPSEWVVGAVPNTGIPAAQGYAEASGLELRRIFIKNEYVGRTFIQPDERLRSLDVKLKLLCTKREVRGKKVVVIEDSIVRATTTSQLVPLLKEAGAEEVHMRITSPPYKWCCPLGTDTQDPAKLIAATKSVEEIRQHIGADSLGYLSLQGVINAIDPTPGYGFCTGCFNAEYPLELP